MMGSSERRKEICSRRSKGIGKNKVSFGGQRVHGEESLDKVSESACEPVNVANAHERGGLVM
jgi:hypothetical protein